MANFDHPIDFVNYRLMDFEDYNVPFHTQRSLSDYYLNGLEPGGFLMKMLIHADLPADHWYWVNDGKEYYRGAAGAADPQNRIAIPEIRRWIVDKLPDTCYGSEEKIWTYIRSLRS